MKTAIVIGATGLVGKQLVLNLLDQEEYDKIKVLTRRSLELRFAEVEEFIVDFDDISKYKEILYGDVLFSAMGTTLKKAGSKVAQYKIDYTFQYKTAKIAAQNGVSKYVLVSASGAKSESPIFYNKMKGELEDAVKDLPFEQINIFKPSLLVGERDKSRMGEKIGFLFLAPLAFLPLVRKYRPVKASIVAQAMINAARNDEKGVFTYRLDEIFDLAE